MHSRRWLPDSVQARLLGSLLTCVPGSADHLIFEIPGMREGYWQEPQDVSGGTTEPNERRQRLESEFGSFSEAYGMMPHRAYPIKREFENC